MQSLSSSEKAGLIQNILDEVEKVELSQKCTLCLSSRKNSTVTQCGHVFCWDCIVEWQNEKSECPLCRQEIDPSKFLLAANF